MKLWTAAEVEQVVGNSTAALALTVHRLRTHYTEPAEDIVAWGQYLDDEHSTGEQWGLYGTAAATQILAMHFKRAGEQASAQPLVAGALRLLPENLDEGHPLLREKQEKGDFDNVLKLAAIAEALRPDTDQVPLDVEPVIVAGLREVGSAGGAWFRAARVGPTGSGFLPPPRRTVHAVLPHTAHRRPLPPAFGLARQSRKGAGVTTVPSRLIRPIWSADQ